MLNLRVKEVVSVAVALVAFGKVAGHGMMLKPPNRSSLWRFDPEAPKNYNDNQNYCGGLTVQWETHHGKCGVCGDNYGDPIPRDNENTGKYGRGKVVAEYEEGSVIDVDILLTANHIGWFNYSLCRLEDPTKPETDDCFSFLKSPEGNYRFPVSASNNHYTNRLVLPKNFTCERCVLRWNYRAGNSWGNCGHGRSALGCGPQEHFRSCSDIAIVAKGQLDSESIDDHIDFDSIDNAIDQSVEDDLIKTKPHKQTEIEVDWDNYESSNKVEEIDNNRLEDTKTVNMDENNDLMEESQIERKFAFEKSQENLNFLHINQNEIPTNENEKDQMASSSKIAKSKIWDKKLSEEKNNQDQLLNEIDERLNEIEQEEKPKKKKVRKIKIKSTRMPFFKALRLIESLDSMY